MQVLVVKKKLGQEELQTTNSKQQPHPRAARQQQKYTP